MIDQRFKDYIHQQFATGVSSEDIRKVLVINGLSEQDIAEGFATFEKVPSVSPPQVPAPQSIAQPAQLAPIVNKTSSVLDQPVKSIWGKGIPRTNKGFMIASVILVFGLDLVILLVSGFSLLLFWIEMLVVLGIFAIFFYLENYVFSKKFASTKSALDPWISGIIVARNLIFLLNFIPLIQVLGMMLLGGFLAIIPAALLGGNGGFGLGGLGGLGGTTLIMPGLLVLYIILIVFRFSTIKQRVTN